MGLPLTMEPNYDTFECQFSFGKTPTDETEALAKSTPCLMRCPAVGSLRRFHDANAEQQQLQRKSLPLSQQRQQQRQRQQSTITTTNTINSTMTEAALATIPFFLLPAPASPCKMMGD
jgi:Beta-carotene isomerase D27-like, C-terminal